MFESSRQLGGVAERLIDGAKNAFVGWALNFVVHMLLKGVVSLKLFFLKTPQQGGSKKYLYISAYDAIIRYGETQIKDVRADCFCASFCARKFTRHVMHERMR